MSILTIIPVFFAASSVILTLTFGILQILGESPFTERNVTLGWVYISLSMTVAAFLGMYIGFCFVCIYDQFWATYKESVRIHMEEKGQISSDHQEIDLSDLSDQTKRTAQNDKKVRFDFNHVTIV